MSLPPLTFTEAANLYRMILDSDGDVVTLAILAADPTEMLAHLASALVVFGRQLERDQKVILEQKDSIEELNAHLRAYLDDHLDRAVTGDKCLVDEMTIYHKELGPIDKVQVPSERFTEDQINPISTVEWRGPAGDYFDRFPEINKELAKGISEMARENIAHLDPADFVTLRDADETTEAEDKGVIEG